MKTGLFLSFLLSACLLSGAQSQCNLTGGKFDVPFPNIMKYVADSYMMKVEYSAPGAKQTDFYTEFYEYEFKRGRLDGHQNGKKFKYVYQAESYEAWNIGVNKCELVNITQTPDFMKNDMTEWMHSSGTEQFTTIGPSAMLKNAYDQWKKLIVSKAKTFAYMGKIKAPIRGESAVFFRRCLGDISENSYVDYFFAAEEEENAFDEDVYDKNITPLRVAFFNLPGKEKELATQFYDIMLFRHEIPKGFDPFQLPKGQNCQRGPLADGPKMPDFSTNSMMISAEVLYRKISTKDNDLISSYYNTFMFALDREIMHIAYKYSSWNTTKPDKDHQEPFLNSPKYIVFDMTHGYTYKMNWEGRCQIARDEKFYPVYKLPEKGGNISITDPYILFPDNQFTFLTKGKERGLTVNIYEAYIEQYVLDAETLVKKVYATRSYLTENEEIENTVSVRNPLVQVELHFFRTDNVEEILTFNIFGFTTKLPKKMNLFDISSCFKNEDDYLYLTLGFEPEPQHLPELEKKLVQLENNVLNQITMKSELNAVRIPYVMTDLKKNFIFMTMLILGKPPLILDFTKVEQGKTISVASQNDVQGVSTFDICANNCLETKSGCWGFAMCGNTCYFGTSDSTKVESKANCTLYRRYTNNTYVQSKEVQANNIVSQVEAGEFMTMVILDSGEKVELKATIAEITDPAEDDELFEKMGNMLNPRMRVLKASYKLKKASDIKNLGKLRYDECQKLCLDFKDCETISYCLLDSKCSISSKLGVDLKDADFEEDNLCTVLTRKYADHFDRTPGVFASQTGGTKVAAKTVEDCARECLKQNQFQCKSFDHCAGGDREGCYLYTVHYIHSGSGKPAEGKSPRCGHYSRKYSVDFKKKDEARVVGGDFKTILNITLEECAQRCIEVGGGACYGYDFCQDQAMYATSCTLIDSDPSRLKFAYNPSCSNYGRTAPEYAPRPYTTGFAGGIGFLCFLIGGVVGAVIVFAIAYIRVNRQR